MRSHYAQYIALVALAIPLVLGCGPGNKLGREAVTGNVTLDGRPLAQGSIMFEPADGGSAMGGGPIDNGAYQLSVKGGLPPGKYVVRISAAATGRNATASAPPGDTPGIAFDAPEMIPPEWNSRSQQTVEVGKEGNVFNFDIKTK